MGYVYQFNITHHFHQLPNQPSETNLAGMAICMCALQMPKPPSSLKWRSTRMNQGVVLSSLTSHAHTMDAMIQAPSYRRVSSVKAPK